MYDTKTDQLPEKTLVIYPVLKNTLQVDLEYRLQETMGLAAAINLEVISGDIVNIAKLSPSTYLGSGKVSSYKGIIAEFGIALVIMDTKLSPIQQRNLEQAWKCKVIERTALIIEIFGRRAKTREGKLQVDLARLEYQKSRLVRSWTHLERQRGGFGFLAGPGEKQIEVDRRIIAEQISKIKRELEIVKNTRNQHRKARKSVPYPVVALVGYTNAGKTTLFNYLTGEQLLAADMLFATLDPAMRMVTLPSRRKMILSDTVGFISDLPTELIAAFRATLEEVVEADVILHVRDISHSETNQQKEDVSKVITNLGIGYKLRDATIEVWNKIDLLANAEEMVAKFNSFAAVAISAVTGENCATLIKLIDEYLAKDDIVLDLVVDAADGKFLAWIYEHAEVIERNDKDESIYLLIRISPKNEARLQTLITNNNGGSYETH